VLLQSLDIWVFEILYWLAVPVGLFAFIHAALQRADAYTATDKLTKPAWLGITGASLAMLVLFEGPRSSGLMFWIAALVAVLVYIVDVRPALQTVQGGGQRW
jgi:multisubunit Na+/H+ antiporter MnhG subunit